MPGLQGFNLLWRVIFTPYILCYQDREDGILHRFYEEIMNSGGDFMEKLTAMPNVTLFAPSNAAFNDPSIQPYLINRTYIRSLLDLHIVNRRLSLDDIDSESVDKVRKRAIYIYMFFLFNFLWYCVVYFIFTYEGIKDAG